MDVIKQMELSTQSLLWKVISEFVITCQRPWTCKIDILACHKRSLGKLAHPLHQRSHCPEMGTQDDWQAPTFWSQGVLLSLCLRPWCQMMLEYNFYVSSIILSGHVTLDKFRTKVPVTILRPSARCISPDSTRVLSIHVTLVGALSASSTTSMWPHFTARTCDNIEGFIRFLVVHFIWLCRVRYKEFSLNWYSWLFIVKYW